MGFGVSSPYKGQSLLIRTSHFFQYPCISGLLLLLSCAINANIQLHFCLFMDTPCYMGLSYTVPDWLHCLETRAGAKSMSCRHRTALAHNWYRMEPWKYLLKKKKRKYLLHKRTEETWGLTFHCCHFLVVKTFWALVSSPVMWDNTHFRISHSALFPSRGSKIFFSFLELLYLRFREPQRSLPAISPIVLIQILTRSLFPSVDSLFFVYSSSPKHIEISEGPVQRPFQSFLSFIQ